jgi:hypothetical protein
VTRTAILKWCPGSESNRYVPLGTRDFKSRASASFATRAYLICQYLLYHCPCLLRLGTSPAKAASGGVFPEIALEIVQRAA